MPHSPASQTTAAAVPPSASCPATAGPERAHLLGQLGRPARRLTEPERHRRRRALSVDHADDARLDPEDPPRRGAEQEDVARHALDRPVLVDGADEDVIRLGKDPVVAELGDRAAGRQCREPGTAPAAQLTADLIAVQVRGAATAAGADAL